MNTCVEVRKIAQNIRTWIAHQPHVREESLSDWLLYQMSQKIKNCTTRTFSRNEEGKTTGADWEWFFIFKKNLYYKMRVQAKKVFPDNYPHIAYSNKYGLQIEKLLDNALRTNAVPLYAFYTSEYTYPSVCSLNRCDEGVYISGANTLYANFICKKRQKIEPQKIFEISKPLSSFFCCSLISKENGLAAFVQEYYPLETAQDIAKSLEKNPDDTAVLGRYDKLPSYISCLLNAKTSGLAVFEKEFKDEINSLNALSIFDFSAAIE
jgi:hypothetical protein